jgi:hypothetical protein
MLCVITEDELDKTKSRLALHSFPVKERLAVDSAHPPDWAVGR